MKLPLEDNRIYLLTAKEILSISTDLWPENQSTFNYKTSEEVLNDLLSDPLFMKTQSISHRSYYEMDIPDILQICNEDIVIGNKVED